MKSKTMKKLLALSILLLSATGCTAMAWQKPGSTRSEFEASRNYCITKSYAVAPINNQITGYSSPVVTPRSTSCSAYYGNVTCMESGGVVIADGGPNIQDINQNYRSSIFISCMNEKGFSWKECNKANGCQLH